MNNNEMLHINFEDENMKKCRRTITNVTNAKRKYPTFYMEKFPT